MLASDFDYDLPAELIAQHPLPERDASRLMVLDRPTRQIAHRSFRDILSYLNAGDVLVLNNSKVIPARLRATNPKTSGRFEILLLEEVAANRWWTMLRPAKRARPGTTLVLTNRETSPTSIHVHVLEKNSEGHVLLDFAGTKNILDELNGLGEVPLPPYIRRESGEQNLEDRERYQTVFAEPRGSAAAPTAGLHFTPQLLEEIKLQGVKICFVTLHVGPGTFAPVKTEQIQSHIMHEERFEIPGETMETIEQARRAGKKIVAVGTTALRVLESEKQSTKGRTSLFVYPPYNFKVVDALLTNFHLPRSTLLMLVSAFAAPGGIEGRQFVLQAYAEAIRLKYRFFSYGDAMLLL